MEQFATALAQALAWRPDQPGTRVLVVESRAQGRRMLQWLARQGGPLVNISVETTRSLAQALCPIGPRFLPTQAGQAMVFDLLQATTDPFYSQPSAQSRPVANALYATFQALTLAQEPPLSGSPKHMGTQTLREAYAQRKADLGRLDWADLLTQAISVAKTSDQWSQSTLITLSGFTPSPLESQLLQALFQDRHVVVDLPDQDPTPHLRGDQCRFVACRGDDTQVRFPFRDILEKGYPLEDCAIVYLNTAYADALYHTAQRWEVPVTMAGGVSLSGSHVATTLRQMEAFSRQNFPIALLHPLLVSGVCGPKKSIRLAEQLLMPQVAYGPGLYALGTKPNHLDDADWADWQAFLTLILALGDETLPMDVQQAQLLTFLNNYTSKRFQGDGPHQAVLSLLELAAELCPPGTSLLSQLLIFIDQGTYSPNPHSATSLLCLPLRQALLSGRHRLYIIGLSRYALEAGGRESPILLDAERQHNPHLDTVATRATQTTASFHQLVATHDGPLVFCYHNFDSDRMDSLTPAPFFASAVSALQARVEEVSYLPTTPLTAGDALLSHPDAPQGFSPLPAPAIPADSAQPLPDLRAFFKGFTFSPSSLEMALHCPLSFYFTYVLGLRESAVPVELSYRWLQANEIGTFVHQVLEDYYIALNAGTAPQIAQLFQEEFAKLETSHPCRYPHMVDATKADMLAFVEGAVNWTTRENRTVLATERPFGHDAPFTLDIGGRTIHIKGSIDRVDQLPNGDYAILDYKTSNMANFLAQLDGHLQHYLYTLAQEKLDPSHPISQAGYLLVRGPKNDGDAYCEELAEDATLRATIEAKVAALLEYLETEANLQTPCPCFVLEKNKLVPGDSLVRERARSDCRRYCPYGTLCDQIWEVKP